MILNSSVCMFLTEEEPVREQLEKIAMEEEKIAMEEEKSAEEGEIIVIPDDKSDMIEDNAGKTTEKAMEVQLIKEMENHPPSPMMMVGFIWASL